MSTMYIKYIRWETISLRKSINEKEKSDLLRAIPN